MEDNIKKSNSKLLVIIFSVAFALTALLILLSTFATNSTNSVEAEALSFEGGCFENVADSGASGGSGVLAECVNNSNHLGLDARGEVINAQYQVPSSNTVFMATSGSDNNNGSQSSPVKTIGRAISIVPKGGTVVIREGVYRDAYIPIINGKFATITKQFDIQSYPGEQVWFDGTDVVSNWAKSGSYWTISWDTPNYCQHFSNFRTGGYYQQIWPWEGTPSSQGPCIHFDMAKNPNSDPDPQMVFVNNSELRQVRSLGEVDANSFYHDLNAKKIYIGTNPAGKTVEVTKRPMALTFQGGAGGNKIRGIGFRKYATNQKIEGSYTAGAILVNVPNFTLENTVFKNNSGSGVAVANSTGFRVSSSVFYENGYNGLMANGTAHHGGVNNLIIENSIFNANNSGLFGDGCSASCGQTGVKLAHMGGYEIRNNIFENQYGVAHGFWCDLECVGGKHVYNVFRNNGGHGLYYEVSETGIIASNISHDNGKYGFKVSAENTSIYNNTAVRNKLGGMLIYDDTRSSGVAGWDDVSRDSANLELVNNLFVDNKGVEVKSWRTSDSPPNTGPNTFYKEYDYNSYFQNGDVVPVSQWKDPLNTTRNYQNLAQFRSAIGKWEGNGRENYQGVYPFKGGSPELFEVDSIVGKGKSLPSNVADALYLNNHTDRVGAFEWRSSQSSNDGTASASVTAINNGIYKLWVRVKSNSNSGNLLEATIAGNAYQVGGQSASQDWVWIPAGGSGSQSNISLTSGSHDIVLSDIQNGLTLDKLMITQDGCIPSGTGENCDIVEEPPEPADFSVSGLTNNQKVVDEFSVEVTPVNTAQVNQVRFEIDNQTVRTDTSAPWCLSGSVGCTNYSTEGLNNGTHQLKITMTHEENQSVTKTVNFIVENTPKDTFPPFTDIIDPYDGYKVEGTQRILVLATDASAIEKVEIHINDNLVRTLTDGPYSFNWDSTTIEDGVVKIQATTTDEYNNQSSDVIYVDVKNTPDPDISPPTVPSNFSGALNVEDGTIRLTWGGSVDESGIDSYVIEKTSGNESEEIILPSTARSFTDGDVAHSNTYNYTIHAVDTAQNVGNKSGIVQVNYPEPPDTAAPTIPANVQAVASDSAVTVTWDKSSDNKQVDGYYVYRGASVIKFTTETRFVDSNIELGREYEYRIQAIDSSDNVSALSSVARVRTPEPEPEVDSTPPTIPAGLNAINIYFNQIDIAWQPSTDESGVAGYQIYRDGELISDSKTTTYGDAQLQEGTTYEYSVRAYDAAGNLSDSSDYLSVTTDTMPEEITLVTITGRVTDIDSGDPVKRTRVVLRGTDSKHVYRSNKNGEYYISEVTPGDYKIKFKKRRLGYSKQVFRISVGESEVYKLDVQLGKNQ